LIWGKVTGDFLGLVTLLFKHIRNQTLRLNEVTASDIRSNAFKYKDFPRYQSLAQFLNSLSQNIPFFLLTTLYNPEIAGYYMLTSRILFVPTALIGRSTREVYYQKASEMFADGKSIRDLFFKTTMGLAKLGIIPFIVVGIFARDLFTLFLGAQWLISGIYAQLIIAWSFLGFINPPSTMTIYIMGLQRFSLKYESLLVIFRILSIYLTFLVFQNAFISVGMYAFVGFIFNLILISYCYSKTKKTSIEIQ
jgi:O-antigen/teichoic acid export membrane protein